MKHRGFTLVELVVSIAVIGILAGVVVVSYGSWRTRTAENEVKNDLKQAVASLEDYKNFNDGYPTVAAGIPSTFTSSNNVTITFKSSTLSTYCLQGKSEAVATVIYYASSTKPTPSTTSC